MFDLYKLDNKSRNPMLSAKKAQVKYLFDMAMDREGNCSINGKKFFEAPRIFNYQIKRDFIHTVNIETIYQEDYFKSGDIVTYQGYSWLCSSSYVFHNLYCKGSFWRCNYTLCWQNDNLEKIETPCFVQNSSQANDGVEDNNVLRIGNDQLLIIVPYNEETLALKRDKRFFIDKNKIAPIVYELTRIISVPYSDWDKGCIGLICSESQYNPDTDSIEEWLCDYNRPLEQQITTFEISCSSPQIRCGGNAKTFTAKTDEIITWSLSLLDIQKEFIILTDIGNNQCKIKCLLNNDVIGSSFKLIATANDISQELLINVIGGV